MMKNLLGLAYFIALVILSHVIGERLPRKWFDYTKYPFASFRWERDGDLYDKIHIKKWKKKLPDLSRVMKRMVPKKVVFRSSSAEIDLLLRELCVAETVHIALCVLSFGVLIFARTWFCVVLSILYSFGNIPFILIQRYNRPHIMRLFFRVKAMEEEALKQKTIE